MVLIGSAVSVVLPGTGLIMCLVLFFFIRKLKRDFKAFPGKYKESSLTMLRLSSLLTWVGLLMGIAAVIVTFFTGVAAVLFMLLMMMGGQKIGG